MDGAANNNAEVQERPFQKGFQINKPRKFTPEFACAAIFYASVLVHLILSIMVFAGKNYEPISLVWDEQMQVSGICPDGMVAEWQCRNERGPWSGGCLTKDLCEDLKTCIQTGSNGRLLSDEEAMKVPREGVWEFLEVHAYQPAVLFGAALIVAVGWLFILQKFPKTVVWSTLIFNLLMLGFLLGYFLVAEGTFNFGILAIMILMIIGMFVLRAKITSAAAMMKFAIDGLFANPVIFAVCFGVQLLWVGFFAIWIAGLVTMHFVKEVVLVPEETAYTRQKGCHIGSTFGPGIMIFWVLHYFWVTYFFRNVNVIIITGNLSAWYFEEDGFENNWKKTLPWAFGPLAGGNAMCSALQGFLEYIMAKVGSCWSIVFGILNPIDWIFICLGLCLKTFAQTYTKFALIAHVYSGKGFCAGAPDTWNLMKNWLGQAIVTDYIGKSVMRWITYALSLGVGFAAWAWADAVQNVNSLDMPLAALISVTIVYAYVISQPFFGLLLVILIEQLVGQLGIFESECDGFGQSEACKVRGGMNSIFASVFMACITFFLLTFLSQVVVTSMDVCLFCYAVEMDNGTADAKKQKFYESIKNSIALGEVAGGAALGTPVVEVNIPPEGVVPEATSNANSNVVGKPMDSPNDIV